MQSKTFDKAIKTALLFYYCRGSFSSSLLDFLVHDLHCGVLCKQKGLYYREHAIIYEPLIDF